MAERWSAPTPIDLILTQQTDNRQKAIPSRLLTGLSTRRGAAFRSSFAGDSEVGYLFPQYRGNSRNLLCRSNFWLPSSPLAGETKERGAGLDQSPRSRQRPGLITCRVPSAECPSAECRVPSARVPECRVPSAECRVPSAECRVPSAECRVPSAECRKPLSRKERANERLASHWVTAIFNGIDLNPQGAMTQASVVTGSSVFSGSYPPHFRRSRCQRGPTGGGHCRTRRGGDPALG